MTRLKSISIRNFKAYKGLQEIPLKPLTLIFGPNSSGKSSIIHALAFLKHVSLQNGDCSPDEVDLIWDKVTLGGWQNLLHGHDPKQSMHLGIEFGENVSSQWTFEGSNQGPRTSRCVIAQDGRPLASAVNKRPRQLGWEITLDDQHPKLNSLADRIWSFLWKGDQLRPVSHTHKGASKLPWELFHTQFLDYMRLVPMETSGLFPGALDEIQRKRLQADQWSRSGPNFGDAWKAKLPSGEETQADGQAILIALQAALESGMGTTSHLQDLFRHCLEAVSINKELSDEPGVLAFEQLFQSHVHLGPSREAPPRDIDHQSLDNNAQFGPWLELLEKKDLRDKVNQALDRLGLNYEMVTRWKDTITYFPDSGDSSPNYDPEKVEFRDPKKQLAFQIKNSRITLSHRDLGYGVSMVLPILVALHSSEFDLITMEQPELHIHPRQQAELGDELIAATLRAEKSKQLIIETHSEHLILRILRRIRETTEEELAEWPESLRIACPNGISPDDVAVLYVKPGSEDSSEGSTIIQMPITPDGDFGRPWPGGFFAERSKELF